MASLEEWLGKALHKALGATLEELGAEEVDDLRDLQPQHLAALS